MSYDFTSQDVLDKVREIALANPEFVYQPPEEFNSCLYVHEAENAAGCLVGQALHTLGVPLDALRDHEGTSATAVLVDLINVDPYDTAANTVGRIQRAQDVRMPWGQALEADDEEIVRFQRDSFNAALAAAKPGA